MPGTYIHGNIEEHRLTYHIPKPFHTTWRRESPYCKLFILQGNTLQTIYNVARTCLSLHFTWASHAMCTVCTWYVLLLLNRVACGDIMQGLYS